MFRTSFVVVLGLTLSLVGIQPSQAGGKSFLGGAIVGAIIGGVILNANKPRAQPRTVRTRPASRPRRVVRRRSAAAINEPRLTRTTKADIQEALNQRNFNVGYPDGSFGRNTRRGIKSFQASIAVAVTGYLTTRQVDILLRPAAARAPAAPTNHYNTPDNSDRLASPAAPFNNNNSNPFEPRRVASVQPSSREYAPANKPAASSVGYLVDAPQ